MSSQRESRPPVRWSTHSMQILMVLTVVVGGTLFGMAFAGWPQSTFDSVLGGGILVAVAALVGWVCWYLLRPVQRR
jgi:phosphate/sulfate permease